MTSLRCAGGHCVDAGGDRAVERAQPLGVGARRCARSPRARRDRPRSARRGSPRRRARRCAGPATSAGRRPAVGLACVASTESISSSPSRVARPRCRSRPRATRRRRRRSGRPRPPRRAPRVARARLVAVRVGVRLRGSARPSTRSPADVAGEVGDLGRRGDGLDAAAVCGETVAARRSRARRVPARSQRRLKGAEHRAASMPRSLVRTILRRSARAGRATGRGRDGRDRRRRARRPCWRRRRAAGRPRGRA